MKLLGPWVNWVGHTGWNPGSVFTHKQPNLVTSSNCSSTLNWMKMVLGLSRTLSLFCLLLESFLARCNQLQIEL